MKTQKQRISLLPRNFHNALKAYNLYLLLIITYKTLPTKFFSHLCNTNKTYHNSNSNTSHKSKYKILVILIRGNRILEIITIRDNFFKHSHNQIINNQDKIIQFQCNNISKILQIQRQVQPVATIIKFLKFLKILWIQTKNNGSQMKTKKNEILLIYVNKWKNKQIKKNMKKKGSYLKIKKQRNV